MDMYLSTITIITIAIFIVAIVEMYLSHSCQFVWWGSHDSGHSQLSM
jgi:hypothetical protein